MIAATAQRSTSGRETSDVVAEAVSGIDVPAPGRPNGRPQLYQIGRLAALDNSDCRALPAYSALTPARRGLAFRRIRRGPCCDKTPPARQVT
jgi:hypothetical protein